MGAGNEILERLAVIEAKLDRLLAGSNGAGDGVADDAELDSQYGNPVIKKDPPMWLKDGGASYVGRCYSETSPAYLDAVAKFLMWKAKKNDEEGTEEKKKYAGYDRKDAARARGWAKRLRAKPPANEFDSSDEIDAPL